MQLPGEYQRLCGLFRGCALQGQALINLVRRFLIF